MRNGTPDLAYLKRISHYSYKNSVRALARNLEKLKGCHWASHENVELVAADVLVAEMKLPGRAMLEFRVEPVGPE